MMILYFGIYQFGVTIPMHHQQNVLLLFNVVLF